MPTTSNNAVDSGPRKPAEDDDASNQTQQQHLWVRTHAYLIWVEFGKFSLKVSDEICQLFADIRSLVSACQSSPSTGSST